MLRHLKQIGAALAAVCLVGTLCGCSAQSYTPPAEQPKLDPPVISTAKTLKVGVDASNTPFAAQVAGKIVGFDVDVAAAIADTLGLKLQIMDIGSDPEGALQKGDVDIVMGLDKADSALTCWTSDPYVQSGIALFALDNVNKVPSTDANLKIAAQSSSMSAWEVTNQFGEKSLAPANDLTGAFTNLQNKQVQFAAADAVIGSYVAQTNHFDIHIVALMKKASGYCIGVSKKNTQLQNAIKESLSDLGHQGILSVIESKWLGGPLDLKTIPLTEGARNSKSQKQDDKPQSIEDKDRKPSESSSTNTASAASSDSSSSGVDSAGSGAVKPDSQD